MKHRSTIPHDKFTGKALEHQLEEESPSEWIVRKDGSREQATPTNILGAGQNKEGNRNIKTSNRTRKAKGEKEREAQ